MRGSGLLAPASVPALALLIGGCAGAVPSPAGNAHHEPAITAEAIRMADGERLPLHRWGPETPERVVLALHGFNDYGGSMQAFGEAMAERGIAVYAYDQRGFGATRTAGYWPGYRRLSDDARTALRLLHERHPKQPPYVIGKSMGGAVALLASAGTADRAPIGTEVAGTVLIAPAIWRRGDMPWYQRLALWLGARFAPGWRLSGELAAHLDIRPTDDPEVLERMRADPLVLRETRIDTLDGLTRLMSRALEASQDLPPPSLTLYGARDDLVPPGPFARLLEQLAAQESDGHRVVFYPEGYHMLTRYTGADSTFDDIAAWLRDPEASLPSGHEWPPQALASHLHHLD